MFSFRKKFSNSTNIEFYLETKAVFTTDPINTFSFSLFSSFFSSNSLQNLNRLFTFSTIRSCSGSEGIGIVSCEIDFMLRKC